MSAFEYKALDVKGKQLKGVMEADTARQIRQQLRDKGWTPLNVVEVQQREAKQSQSFSFIKRGISPAELSLITRQLATLMRAGTPIDTALHAVSRQSEKPRLANMMLAVRAKVKEGHSLAAAMADYPHVFDELYRSTVAAGEQSGHLDGVLERLADYTESRHILQQKFQLAMIYPLMIALVAVLVVIGLVAYVVPKVVEVFDDIGQELPILTRGLITVSDFLQNNWLLLVGGLAFSIMSVTMLLRKEGPKRQYHQILLHLPLISRLAKGMNTARFARTFSILASSGVPVLDAMRISSEVVLNIPMREAVEEAARKVREGSPISKALEASGYFPPMTVHLIASGEASGNLDEMLERSASAQEREMETLLGVMMGLFEPFMILFMGGTVLVIVLAILLPIFNMNQLVQ